MTDVTTSPTEPEAAPQRGFQIGGRFYPASSGEKLGDPAIIRAVTGLKWDTYQSWLGVPDPTLTPEEQTVPDIDEGLVLAGEVALAIAHANPGWAREKIVTLVQALDSTDVELIGYDDAPAALVVDLDEEGGLPPTTETEQPSLDSPAPTPASGDQTRDETVEPSPPTRGSS